MNNRIVIVLVGSLIGEELTHETIPAHVENPDYASHLERPYKAVTNVSTPSAVSKNAALTIKTDGQSTWYVVS